MLKALFQKSQPKAPPAKQTTASKRMPLPPPSMQNIIYLSLDFNTFIKGDAYRKAANDYLSMPLEQKINYIVNKIIKHYEALKKIHGNVYLFIFMREGVIGPSSKGTRLGCNILTEDEKNYVVDTLKKLTLNMDLILIPGSLVYYSSQNTEEKGTTVYNRAFVLFQGQEVNFQGKARASNHEFAYNQLPHPQLFKDNENKAVQLHGLKILIQICLGRVLI